MAGIFWLLSARCGEGVFHPFDYRSVLLLILEGVADFERSQMRKVVGEHELCIENEVILNVALATIVARDCQPGCSPTAIG